jgi:deoxyhypusine synthase
MSDDEVTETTPEEWLDPEIRAATRCRIFLSFTSNLISAGTREQFKYLVRATETLRRWLSSLLLAS